MEGGPPKIFALMKTAPSYEDIDAFKNYHGISEQSPDTMTVGNADMTHISTTDDNLSAIIEFNRCYNSDMNGIASHSTSTKGKRPADVADDRDDIHKRLRLNEGETDHTASLQWTPDETVQHHTNAHTSKDTAETTHDVHEGDHTYEDQVDDEWMNALASQLITEPYFISQQDSYLPDADKQMKIRTLPVLDNLASQILMTLGNGTYAEALDIVTQPDSPHGQAYNIAKTLFQQTKKTYTTEAFLSADELQFKAIDQRSTIRKSNLATFLSAVFGSEEIGFFPLNEHFLDTFVPDGGRLLKPQGSLYLDLKTQAYISAISANEQCKDEILDNLFPANMGEILMSRRGGGKQLPPSEQDFVNRLGHRRSHLIRFPAEVSLTDNYAWHDFLKGISGYVNKYHETFVVLPSGNSQLHFATAGIDCTRTKSRQKTASHGAPHPDMTGRPSHHETPQSPLPLSVRHERLAAPATERVSLAPVYQTHSADSHIQPNAQTGGNEQATREISPDDKLFGPSPSFAGASPLAELPVPQQWLPTKVLYERARLAAASSYPAIARRSSLKLQRHPWTNEEETALMAALDIVKGPHWAQILALFGPGGTISEALKDRNQVQLKDKARNLKLFFLKSGIEVPYHLQCVTGDLKTRAHGRRGGGTPGGAAEADEGDDGAHQEAVSVFSNAHHQEVLAYNHISSEDLGQPSVEDEGGSSDQGECSELSCVTDAGVVFRGASSGQAIQTPEVICHDPRNGKERGKAQNPEIALGIETCAGSLSIHEHQVIGQSPVIAAAHMAPTEVGGDNQQIEDTVDYPLFSLASGDLDMRNGAGSGPVTDRARVVSGFGLGISSDEFFDEFMANLECEFPIQFA